MVRYPNFDYLRLFLALTVCVFHAVKRTDDYTTLLPIPMVPAFLALSGFLVLQSWERTANTARFWKKRALRILPALLASFVLVGVLLGWPSVVASLQVYFTLGYVGSDPNVANGVLWSLGWEEICYASLLPLSLIGAFANRRWILWTLFGIFFIATLAERINPFVLPLAFFTGNLIYVYRDTMPKGLIRWSGWTLAVILALRIGEQLMKGGVRTDQNFGTFLLWFIVMPAAILWGLSRTSTKPLKVDLSYGVYIYHIPILLALKNSGVTGLALIGSTVGLTLVAALASWQFIERPALEHKDVPIFKPKNKTEAAPIPVVESE